MMREARSVLEILRGRVSANILGDVNTKIEGYTVFAKELATLLDGAPTAEVAEFLTGLQGRILYGGLKYGPGSWKHVDLLAELRQELYDVAGYSFLEILKEGDGIDPDYKDWLLSMALQGFMLWLECGQH